MFNYPEQARVNRIVAKAKIFVHAKASKRIKKIFVAQVGEILWKYKLSPETINLPARNGINEIEVFEIVLKTPDLEEDVLKVIDKAIPFPLTFQLTHEGQIRFAAAYKRLSEADRSKWVIERLLVGPLHTSTLSLQPLPVALDLASLYEQIVRRHIPLSPRAGEGIAEHVARFQELEAKRKTRQQLEIRLVQEKQFNRKVELNAQLRNLHTEIEALELGGISPAHALS